MMFSTLQVNAIFDSGGFECSDGVIAVGSSLASSAKGVVRDDGT